MATKIIKAQITQRRDTLANWASVNPVLLPGELGFVTDDVNRYKIGDGVHAWNDLPFRGFDGALAQGLGDSTTAAISQKAVTDELKKKVDTEKLATINGQRIDEGGNIEIKVEEFDAEGNYPLLHVGTSDDLAGRGESVPASFGFRASGGKSIKDGRAYIKRIKGNSVVWNQKVKGFASWNLQGGTIEGNEAVWSAESRTGVLKAYSNTFAQHTTHKYLISADVKASSTNVGLGMYYTGSPLVHHSGSGQYERLAVITQGRGDGTDACYLTDTSTSGFGDIRAKNYRCRDLTQMFGVGNEPTTIEDFNARVATLGVDLNAYNEGEVIHMNNESIKSVGDNAWDEQWEQGAIYSHGGFYDTTTAIRAKNFIKVLPNTEYYINRGSDTDGFLFAYDKDFQQISGWNLYGNNKSFITPVNAEYIKFCTGPSYGPIYKNDIMITLVHSGWKQDTDAGYQPYWQDILPLPIIRKYFPQGMMKAGSAHDEIRFNKATQKWEYSKGKIKSVDMGDMAWSYDSANQVFTSYTIMDLMTHPTEVSERNKGLLCSKYSPSSTYIASTMDDKSWLRIPKSVTIKDTSYTDAASFKAAMQGVILYYESNDWEWVELDAEYQNFRDYYNVADFGTEQSQSSVPSAAFSADIIYQFNAVDMIREHELEITELQKVIATMQAQLTSLINGGQ